MVRLNANQIDNLAECSIDLLLRNVNSLSAAKSETTDGRNLVDGVDWEHFFDEGRLLQAREELLDGRCFVVHLLL